MLACDFFPVCYTVYTHIRRISPSYEFVEYDIFHKMSGILLPKIELCIPKSEVHGVIFLRIAEIFLAFDVIAFCMMHQERVFNVIDVCLYGVVRCSPLHECRRRVCKVMRVRERTD